MAQPNAVAAEFKMLRLRHDFRNPGTKAVLAKLPLMLSCPRRYSATVKRKAQKKR